MISYYHILEVFPLLLTFGSAILSSLNTVGKKWQEYVIIILGFLFLYFTYLFLSPVITYGIGQDLVFDIRFNKITLFVGMLFCGSLFVGLFPVRKQITISPNFLYYIAGGLGIILSNNLPTFFVFWVFQRSLPFSTFIKDTYHDRSSGGGTYIIQHVLTFLCLIGLMIMAYQHGVLFTSMTEIPASFFTWPVLLLAFVIVYESHGIFPFHSWIHDIIGKLAWYEISALFLSRAGVLLFVQFLLPTLKTDPDIFKILLLSLSIISSVYWSFRGILEPNVTRATTYFYVAQSSLIITGLQADMVSVRGSYLHMMVISVSGTALWSILSYIQHYFSLKRDNQFYGLAQFYPRLATFFCLFGFCMIGVPLGASFVVEDLVISGLLEQQPYLGLGHIGATCLNGILFFLIFTKLFLGQSPYKQTVKNMDMNLSEMLPYTLALIVMVAIGLLPYLFLEKITW